MSFTFYNPTTANQVAKFQGAMAGAQAGVADYCGIAMAPTTIMNQSGNYALQDSDTGRIVVKKLADDSVFTQKWYDQSTNNQFDFSNSSGGFDASALSRNMTPEQIAALNTNA